MKLNIKHFLLFALLLSFAVLAAERYLSISANKIYTDVVFIITSGIIVAVVCAFIIEINRAARIHAALVLREEYLRETLNSLDEGVITTDVNGIIQQMNPSAENLTGWLYNEAFGKPLEAVYDVLNEETGKRFEHVVKRILSQGKRVAFENNTILKRKDAREIIISNNGAPLRDENGKIAGAVLVFRDITGKKRAEEETRKSRQYLQTILDQSADVICTANDKGEYVSVSAASEKLWGYKPEELIGKSYTHFVYKDDIAKTLATAALVRSGTPITNFENRYVHKNGTPVPVIWSGRWDNESMLMYVVGRDGTEKKKADEKLLQSEKKYRRIVETSQEGISLIDENNRTTFVNKKFSEMFGYTFEEMMGKSIYDLLDDEGKVLIAKKIEQRKQGISEVFEQIYIAANGDKVWTQVAASPIVNDEGVYIGSLAMFTDITARKKAEALLQENFNTLQTASEMQASILDALPANIALLNKEGVIVDVNESWIRFGHENGMRCTNYGIGENYIELSEKATGETAETGKQMAEGIRQVINGNLHSFQIEYPCHFENKQRWYSAKVAPLIKKGRRGAVVMHLEITEKKLAEIALGHMNNELELRVNERTNELMEANKELEAFSYTVSHDLQAPLRVINGFSKILLDDYAGHLDEEGKAHLYVIRDRAKGMSELIRDLLAFAKLGKRAPEKRSTDIQQIVEAIVTEAIALQHSFEPEIKVHELAIAHCDPALIKQVWRNLIYNAVKYSKKKTQPRIEIGMQNMNGEAAYYVKDNGAGFDMRYADQLFGVFKRLHADTDFEGTGVGLATAHRIITKHGGRIWADAKVNEGAAFYFTLPG